MRTRIAEPRCRREGANGNGHRDHDQDERGVCLGFVFWLRLNRIARGSIDGDRTEHRRRGNEQQPQLARQDGDHSEDERRNQQRDGHGPAPRPSDLHRAS